MKIVRLPKEVNSEDAFAVHKNIAINIRLARMNVGMSQKEMAKALGKESATAVSLMESGDRRVSAATLWKISVITGESVRDFFFNGLIPTGKPTNLTS